MTKEQYARWYDFALRMAENVYPKATRERKRKILSEVKNYFDEREYQEDWPEIEDWDGHPHYLCDSVDEFFNKYRHWQRKSETFGGWFHNQITCCIRAGFDLAVKQSGGVIGFTAGDVRRMYGGNVPDWITDRDWDTPFELIPDNDQIWL